MSLQVITRGLGQEFLASRPLSFAAAAMLDHVICVPLIGLFRSPCASVTLSRG